MAQDEVILDGDLSLDIPLDGDVQLDLQLDGTVGLMTLIEAGIAQIIFNDDYTITFIMTDGREFTTGSIRGAVGEKGDKGDKGDTGERGPQGIQGESGQQGIQGIQGERGEKGEQGIQGEKGDKGDTGATGEKGPQGETGPQGAKGDKGDTGASGKDGSDGISPTVSITTIPGGHRITITDADGQHSADVMDGDDYVLTAQDKSDIAGLVDVPVDDVQVNGISVVTDGVANIPVATNNNLGVVKTGSTIGILNTGEIGVIPATSNDVKAGTNGNNPITPTRQHASTFYGLAKASGDTTQAQSNNAVGTYTDEAKIAIKQMLGIKESNPQIIHQVFTVNEETKNLYFHFGKKLKKIWIGITQNSVYDVTASMYFRLISADNTRLTSFYTPRVTHTSYTKYYVRCWAEVNDFGITDMFCTGTSNDKGAYVAPQSHPGMFVIDKNLFEGVELQLNNASSTTKWAVGTEFEIYALLQDGETAD